MVAGSIPSQGACLDCGPAPQCERQPIDVSLSHSASLPLSVKTNKALKKEIIFKNARETVSMWTAHNTQ